MIKKVIKYTDYNGIEREEPFYFNLTKTELTKMALSSDGDLAEKLRGIIAAKDTKAIMAIFDDVIVKSFGIKSEDGKQFKKSEEISRSFTDSPAYDELYFELIQDPEKFAAFVNAIIPANLAAEVKKMQAEEEKKLLNN